MIPCAGVAFLVSVFFIKAHDLNREDEKALKEQGKQWAEKHSKKHRHEKKDVQQGVQEAVAQAQDTAASERREKAER